MMAERNLHLTVLLSIHQRRQSQSQEKVLSRALTSSLKDKFDQNAFILVDTSTGTQVDLLLHLLSNGGVQIRHRHL